MRRARSIARSLSVFALVFALAVSLPGVSALSAYAATGIEPLPASPRDALLELGPDATQAEIAAAQGYVGVQAYGPTTVQLAGANRIETAVAVSKAGWSSSDAVVIATSRQFPDALVGGPLAFLLDAPILLTEPNALPASVATEIRRLGATSAVVLGGTAVVSDAVVSDLAALGIPRPAIVRLGGTNRYDTARIVAQYMGPSGRATLAVGTNFPDALSVSALAGRTAMPILLTDTKSLPAPTAAAIASIGATETLVIGGVNAISEAVATAVPGPTRIAGANRFDTARLVDEYACRFGLGFNKTFVATGLNFPDALAVGPLAAKWAGSLVLATPTTLPPATENFFLDHCSSVATIYYVGGPAAVGTNVRTAIAAAAQTLISEFTVVADSDSLSKLETITADGDMVFTAPATSQLANMNPAAGRVLYLGESGYAGAPDGFIREVTGKSSGTPGKYILYTKEMPLEEAIAKGSVDYAEPVEDLEVTHASIDAVSGQLVPDAGVSSQLKLGFELSCSLNLDIGLEQGSLSGAITTQGEFSLAGGVFINVSIYWFKVKSFNCGVYGAESADANVEVWAQIQKRLEKVVYDKFLKGVTFWVGPVPVCIIFVAEVYVGIEGTGRATLVSGFHQEASIEYGIQYKRGDGWSRIDKRTFEWGYVPPTAYGELDARAFAGVRIKALLYGVAGPYVGAEGGMYFTARFPIWQAEASTLGPSDQPVAVSEVEPLALGDANPPSEVSWELGTYAKLNIGLELKFWILRLAWQFEIEIARQMLDEYEAQAPPPGSQPVLGSVMSLDPTHVRLNFDVYEFPAGTEQEIVSFTPSKITVWDGESETAGVLPITDCVVDPTDDSSLILTTGEQTLKKYWVKCESGAVTDDAARGSDFAHRPFAATHYATVTPVVGNVWYDPPAILDGVGGLSRWVVWAGGPNWDGYDNVYVHDVPADVTTQLTFEGRYEGGNEPVSASEGTVVFQKWSHTLADGVYAVSATSGVEPWLVEENATSPQVSGDWVCYLAPGELFPALVAERLSTHEQYVVQSDFGSSYVDRYELSDGKVMIEHGDLGYGAYIEVVDLEQDPPVPVFTYPASPTFVGIGQTRLEGDAICWTEGGTRVILADLSEASPVARRLEAPELLWTGLDVWGDNVICRTGAFPNAELWAGDLGLERESWVRVIMPSGWALETSDPLSLYGGQLGSLLMDESESTWICVVSP